MSKKSSASIFLTPSPLDLFMRVASHPEVFSKEFIRVISNHYSDYIIGHAKFLQLISDIKSETGHAANLSCTSEESIELPNGLTMILMKDIEKNKLYRYALLEGDELLIELSFPDGI